MPVPPRLPALSRLLSLLFILVVLAAACGTEEPTVDETPGTAAGDGTPAAPSEEGAGEDETADEEPAELVTVRYADQVRTTQFAPLFVAMRKGFFEEEGVHFDAITLESRSAMAALVGDELDIIGHALHGAVQLRSQGQPVRALVVLQRPAINSLIVHVDHQEAVEEVSDLQGLRIAVTGFGGTTHEMLKVILAEAGMTDQDVTIVELGGAPAGYIAAFQRGEVDAAMTFQPVVGTLIQQMELAYSLVNLGAGEGPSLLQDISTTLLASERLLEESPEAAEGVVRAIARADDYMRDPGNFEEVLELLMDELGQSEEELRPALEELIPASNPEITEEMVASAHEFLKQTEVIEQDVEIPFDELVAEQAVSE